jgi:hypothetical protein
LEFRVSDPKIVASGKKQVHPGSVPRDSSQSWLVLGWIGLVFLVVGGSDFLFTWIPLNLGVPEWEFGTVTQSFNGLPILLLGLGLLTTASEEVGRGWWGLLGLGASALTLVWVSVGAVLWSLNVSIALETVPENLSGPVREAVVKTALQAAVYVLALGYLVGRRIYRGRRPRAAGMAG